MSTPRPTRNDPQILAAAAKRLAPKVKQWLGHDDDTPIGDIEADLIMALRYNDDGYEIAKELDGTYSPDAQLVEILDDASWDRSRALEIACTAWVEENKLQPIPVGTRVTWPRKKDYGEGVVGHNFPDGRATVAFEKLGQKVGTGYIVEWEQLMVEVTIAKGVVS
jgi:hypothetical protein